MAQQRRRVVRLDCGVCRTGFDSMGPVWVKLTRVGNDFSAYYSTNGVDWTQVGSTQTIVMSDTLRAGLAVSSLNAESPSAPRDSAT